MDAILRTGTDAEVGQRHRRVVTALAGAGGVFLSVLLPHLAPVLALKMFLNE
jgi:hypothetical protein